MRYKPFSPSVRTGLVALLAAAAVGCGNSPKNKIVAVEGKIHYSDGKPLPAGTRLLFNPYEGGMGTAEGVTDGEGSFKMTHVTGIQGAEVGKYSVVLQAPEGEEGKFYKFVPKDYYDGGAFAVEVKEGMQPLDLKVLKRRK